MKIVTYNVNGLRPRIAQHGSLLKLLDSLDADIICFQETKLSRQELTADLVMASGYESFFSCTRTSGPGRVGYSGVATFCRVKSAFASNEVALPVAAAEGFTGLMDTKNSPVVVEGLGDFERSELLKVDSEGRCVVTDHGHFVLFNLYGPRAGGDDTDRIRYKQKFYEVLQKRWESLLRQGRRIVVVGDLNIAPAAVDRCEADSDFEKNEFRKWLRSMFVENGGSFYDVFRTKHPERREAYTCWSQSTGAEEFNYGSRIDHILVGGACLHQEFDKACHDFVSCHVLECDIVTEFKRWKPGVTPRWKGGRSAKLEGSDHAPVFVKLMEVPETSVHNTPPLSSRYVPGVRGLQQTLASTFLKRQAADQAKDHVAPLSTREENSTACSSSEIVQTSLSDVDLSHASSEITGSSMTVHKCSQMKLPRDPQPKKRPKNTPGLQLSLKSFFQKRSDTTTQGSRESSIETTCSGAAIETLSQQSCESQPTEDDEVNHTQEPTSSNGNRSNHNDHIEHYVASTPPEETHKNGLALLEWQRIQQRMQSSLPMCKGHKEQCVSRVVKKAGPTYGRRFYVCARPEGPSSNPEANCGYFKWAAASKSQKK